MSFKSIFDPNPDNEFEEILRLEEELRRKPTENDRRAIKELAKLLPSAYAIIAEIEKTSPRLAGIYASRQVNAFKQTVLSLDKDTQNTINNAQSPQAREQAFAEMLVAKFCPNDYKQNYQTQNQEIEFLNQAWLSQDPDKQIRRAVIDKQPLSSDYMQDITQENDPNWVHAEVKSSVVQDHLKHQENLKINDALKTRNRNINQPNKTVVYYIPYESDNKENMRSLYNTTAKEVLKLAGQKEQEKIRYRVVLGAVGKEQSIRNGKTALQHVNPNDEIRIVLDDDPNKSIDHYTIADHITHEQKLRLNKVVDTGTRWYKDGNGNSLPIKTKDRFMFPKLDNNGQPIPNSKAFGISHKDIAEKCKINNDGTVTIYLRADGNQLIDTDAIAIYKDDEFVEQRLGIPQELSLQNNKLVAITTELDAKFKPLKNDNGNNKIKYLDPGNILSEPQDEDPDSIWLTNSNHTITRVKGTTKTFDTPNGPVARFIQVDKKLNPLLDENGEQKTIDIPMHEVKNKVASFNAAVDWVKKRQVSPKVDYVHHDSSKGKVKFTKGTKALTKQEEIKLAENAVDHLLKTRFDELRPQEREDMIQRMKNDNTLKDRPELLKKINDQYKGWVTLETSEDDFKNQIKQKQKQFEALKKDNKLSLKDVKDWEAGIQSMQLQAEKLMEEQSLDFIKKMNPNITDKEINAITNKFSEPEAFNNLFVEDNPYDIPDSIIEQNEIVDNNINDNPIIAPNKPDLFADNSDVIDGYDPIPSDNDKSDQNLPNLSPPEQSKKLDVGVTNKPGPFKIVIKHDTYDSIPDENDLSNQSILSLDDAESNSLKPKKTPGNIVPQLSNDSSNSSLSLESNESSKDYMFKDDYENDQNTYEIEDSKHIHINYDEYNKIETNVDEVFNRKDEPVTLQKADSYKTRKRKEQANLLKAAMSNQIDKQAQNEPNNPVVKPEQNGKTEIESNKAQKLQRMFEDALANQVDKSNVKLNVPQKELDAHDKVDETKLDKQKSAKVNSKTWNVNSFEDNEMYDQDGQVQDSKAPYKKIESSRGDKRKRITKSGLSRRDKENLNKRNL